MVELTDRNQCTRRSWPANKGRDLLRDRKGRAGIATFHLESIGAPTPLRSEGEVHRLAQVLHREPTVPSLVTAVALGVFRLIGARHGRRTLSRTSVHRLRPAAATG
jgi:hypothetical protein